MSTAIDLSDAHLAVLHPHDTVPRALKKVLQGGLGGAPVIHDGELLGEVTLERLIALKDDSTHTVGKLIEPAASIHPDAGVLQLLELFIARNSRFVAVVDENGEYCGCVTMPAFLLALREVFAD